MSSRRLNQEEINCFKVNEKTPSNISIDENKENDYKNQSLSQN